MISKLIRGDIRACGLYPDFLDRRLLLTRKLLNKGFLVVNLKSSFRKSLVITITWLSMSQMICSVCRNLSPFMTYHRICSKSNTTGGTCGLISLRLGFRRNFMQIQRENFFGMLISTRLHVDQKLLTGLSGAPDFIPVFSVVPTARSFVFCVMFCKSLFVLFLLAIVLSVRFGLRIPITTLVFSNFFVISPVFNNIKYFHITTLIRRN